MIGWPAPQQGPVRALALRICAAAGLVVFIALVVLADRDGYRDVNGDGLTLLDSLYYSVVSLSTTGYGDITPVTESARLVNILLVTPARVLFLIILVGTTLDVLTSRFRYTIRLSRWRRTLKNHVIVCGYGTKGRAAVRALVENGTSPRQIVVVESDSAAARQANADGFVVVEGNASRSEVLTEAGVRDAQTVIIAAHSDETAVLVALTVRQLTAGKVRVIAAVREDENVPLLKQSGAHHVVVSSSNAGRLLGLSTTAPPLIDIVGDLLSPATGVSLATRSARRDEIGLNPRDLNDLVIGLFRRGKLVNIVGEKVRTVETGDTVIYIRDTNSLEQA